MRKLISICLTLLLLASIAGCGEGKSTAGDEATDIAQAPRRTANLAEAPLNQNTPLTASQLEKAREHARVLAGCFREGNIVARTDPESVRSTVLARSRGVMLRLEWGHNAADVAILGTDANAERTRRTILDKKLQIAEGRVVILFDQAPTIGQEAAVTACLKTAESQS